MKNKRDISEAPLINLYEKNRILLLPFFLMLTVLIGGTAATLLNPAFYNPPPADWNKMLTGVWSSEYQARYEEDLPVRSFSRTVWGVLRYLLFKEGEVGVLVGSEGWLYTTEEFTYHQDAEDKISRAAAYTAEVRDILKSHSIELAVVTVPAKARVYAEYLGRYEFPVYHRERYESFRAKLEGFGIPAPDILEALERTGSESGGSPVFLRTDTHWSPAGAQAAAEAAAEILIPILASQGIPQGNFERDSKKKVTYTGDLMSFIPLGPLADVLGPEPDTVNPLETVHNAEPQQNLFGDIQFPVALIGTSYSAGELWDFQGALEAALDVNVLNSSAEGGGAFSPMREFLSEISARDDIDLNAVIWEIPERYVSSFESQ